MKPWYNLSATEIIDGLKTDASFGLTIEQVDENRELYGKNTIVFTESKALWKIILGEIFNIWSIFIMFFIACNIYIGYFCIATIYAILYTIIIISIIYYRKTGQSKTNTIDKLNLQDVLVVREGKYKTIAAEDIVVGDIVIVDKGMYVPADIRIITCNSLKVNELPVTGREYIEEKYASKIRDRDISIEDMNNMLFKASVIVSGDGAGVVVATGMDTKIGALVNGDEEHKNKETYFKLIKNLLNIASICLGIIYIACIAIAIYKNLSIGLLLELLNPLTISSLPMVMVIEVLLLIKYFILYNKKKNIYINNISFFEKLSSIKSVFLEKAGVLTEEEYVVDRVFIDSNMLSFDERKLLQVEKSYEGDKKIKDTTVTPCTCPTLKRLMEVAILCNDANFNSSNNTYSGNEIDIGILKFITNTSKLTLKNKAIHKRIFTIPVVGSNEIKTSVNIINGKFRANIFGSFDNILKCCTSVLKRGLEIELSTFEIDILKQSAYDMNVKGLEVFALAYRNFRYKPSVHENIESNLVLVGLVAMENPIKESTYQLNEIVSNLHMEAVIFTQENKLRLKYFGEKTNIIPSYSNVYSGVELSYMESTEIINIINHENLFSNLSEDQKLAIVNEHKINRGMVCVLASKLISVPHFTKADIPISFGIKSSNIIRKISNVHFDYIDSNKLFEFMFYSSELLKTCREIIGKGIQYSISMAIPILLGIIINMSSIIKINHLIYLQIIVIGISGLSTIINNKNKAIVMLEVNYLKTNKEDNLGISEYIKKGILYGVIAYLIYCYISWEWGIGIGKKIFFIVMGILLSISPLISAKKDKTKKSLGVWISVLINILCISLYIVNLV